MNKTLKTISDFFKRVFNCTCKKIKSKIKTKNKRTKSRKMKGG